MSRPAGEHFKSLELLIPVRGPCPGWLVSLPAALLGCRAVEHLPIGSSPGLAQRLDKQREER